ncbi:hypothetical protein [Natronobiforma cellulositropha]|uniref:hypothetical protein n=1 Tax=Natronobiforma cellulositropha TaxID=1679076 RepID=UPI0021D5EA74|nr:hypothetical protein [Natronobiforma cellulositropha]
MRISRHLSGDRTTPPALANFDSTTVFVRATARYLRGEAFPALGLIHPKLAALAPLGNRLPRRIRNGIYTYGGANEGIDPDALGEVDVETFRRWVVEQYPERGYPAVLVGSSNGAGVSLAAMLGVPYLPQTFFVPVRRSLHPDSVRADVAWGRRHAGPFLEANPDVGLSQMHDPNQDRLMVRKLAYFRVKSHTLGPAYESFLETVLDDGGTVLSLECSYDWPVIDLGERHHFQLGGLGGLEPEEYYEGSERIAAFLADQGSPVRAWDVPDPDGRRPEAEWGFDPALRRDLERVTDREGYERRRFVFDDPRDLSPFVADRYRERYARRGRPTDRLLVGSFALLEPWWTCRTGSVPYWSAFTTQPDAARLERYLADAPAYDDVYATLFSHGVDSAGLASAERWRSVLDAARDRAGFVGVDPSAYPSDIESHVRYHADLPDEIDARHPLLPPVPFERFLERTDAVADEYDLRAQRW